MSVALGKSVGGGLFDNRRCAFPVMRLMSHTPPGILVSRLWEALHQIPNTHWFIIRGRQPLGRPELRLRTLNVACAVVTQGQEAMVSAVRWDVIRLGCPTILLRLVLPLRSDGAR